MKFRLKKKEVFLLEGYVQLCEIRTNFLPEVIIGSKIKFYFYDTDRLSNYCLSIYCQFMHINKKKKSV